MSALARQDGAVVKFEMPEALVRESQNYDAPDSDRRAWMVELPLIVEQLARGWSLLVGRPFQPGGVTSWVAPAWAATGEHVVLKVGWRHDEALHEADGLRAWDGHGAVRLLAAILTDTTSALLLEPCEPGISLSQVLPPTQQDVVVAGLLRRLWIQPADGHPFRTLASMCARWADEFDMKYAAAPGPRLDAGLARVGIELFRALPGSAERSVLLCTDLHPDNVLAAAREPWLVIDPNPYVGDPTYDPLQYMLNFPRRLLADPAGFAHRMADLLGLDPDRLRQWLFARCVQESVDQPDLRDVAVQLAP